MTPESLFKCLSDPTRLTAALLVFSEGECCVCELVQAMQESQPKISRHLAHLRNCGVLRDHRQEQWVYYQLATELPEWARQVLQLALDAAAGDRMDNYRRKLRQSRTERSRRCQP